MVKEQIALFRILILVPTSIVVGCTVAEATFQFLGLGFMKEILVLSGTKFTKTIFKYPLNNMTRLLVVVSHFLMSDIRRSRPIHKRTCVFAAYILLSFDLR